MKLTRIMVFLCLYCIMGNTIIHSTQLVPGNASSPLSVTQPITTSAFDVTTGTFYMGLSAGAQEFAIAKANRTINYNTPELQGIASDALLNNKPIEFLTLTSPDSNNNRFLAMVTQEANPFEQTTVILSNNAGSQVTQSAALNDASGAINENGETTHGIVAITASNSFIFAAVRPAGIGSPQMDDAFGNRDSGIAVIKRRSDNNTLVQTAAQSGDFGIKAARLDPTAATVRITSDPTIKANHAQLVWDDTLQRLYTGLTVTTGAGAGDGAKSVAVGRVNTVGALTFANIAPNTAFSAAVDTNMVGTIGSGETIAVYALAILHASTGPDYLIINGGNTTPGNETHNTIFALPLVNDPTNISAHGTVAKKDAPLVNFSFITPATNNADLPQSTEPAVMVGAGSLPIQESTPITDIFVSGDAVYVSLGGAQNSTNDTGIFYSQALFDQTGKIIRWTPWTKATFPAGAFSNNTDASSVQFFAVDATDGRVWSTDDGQKQTLLITNWDRGTSLSLIGQLNTLLSSGAFSFLDLDQSTRGFTGATAHRYALFGGSNSVVFTRTSTAFAPTINSPQMVSDDFSLAQNSLLTTLPPQAGQVRVLEYARQLTGDTTNYFFAGTNQGLFAFTDSNGVGFDVASLDELDQPPFTTFSWRKIASLSAAVIDIKTTGNSLYVLTYHAKKSTSVYRIYRFSYEPTIEQTIQTQRLIAQSGIGVFSNITLFNTIGIIATQPDGSQEQLVLATNAGLYKSSSVTGVQNANSQAEADWQLIDAPNKQWFAGMGFIDNAALPNSAPSILWPFSLVDSTNCGFFNQASIAQLLGSTNQGPFTFIPSPFTSNSFGMLSFNPISYFWSDGLRRLFITLSKTGQSQLLFLPYDTSMWRVTSLHQQLITATTSPTSNFFYWAGLIGATGIFAVGTGNGVIALE